jgi:hypothetical protein
MKLVLRAVVFTLLLQAAGLALAQEVYFCIDSKGHKITADRPIADCLDREQKVIGAGGTVKRIVGPSLTAQERAVQEDAQKHEAEELARVAEERRRDRALLMRYPNKEAHDRERGEAIGLLDDNIRASQLRLEDLAQQRKALDVEMEFYKKDSSKAPASLKHRISENVRNIAAQNRFLKDQDEEKKRINQRFDEELVKLAPRWAQQAAATAPMSASGSSPKGK